MKKVIRLRESELVSLVKRIIEETYSDKKDFSTALKDSPCLKGFKKTSPINGIPARTDKFITVLADGTTKDGSCWGCSKLNNSSLIITDCDQIEKHIIPF